MIVGVMALSMAAAMECRRVGSHAQIGFKQRVARPGDRLNLVFTYRDGPDGDKAVPLYCITKARVRGRAALEPRFVVRITRDATPGSVVTAVALIGDSEVSTTITVIGADEQVLTGKWHPGRSLNCRGRALGELIFTTEGSFSYTFRNEMIETRTSGGGRYTWDAASGRLTLNGRAGTAGLSAGELTIEGVDFDHAEPMPVPPPGSPQPPPRPACRISLRSG